MQTFAERLRALREKQGMSQAELARKIGVSREQISHLESDLPRYRNPTLSTMQRLADGLGISAGILADNNAFRIFIKNIALQNQAASARELLYAVVEVLEQIPGQPPCAGRP